MASEVEKSSSFDTARTPWGSVRAGVRFGLHACATFETGTPIVPNPTTPSTCP
jgi:hypothetical protein